MPIQQIKYILRLKYTYILKTILREPVKVYVADDTAESSQMYDDMMKRASHAWQLNDLGIWGIDARSVHEPGHFLSSWEGDVKEVIEEYVCDVEQDKGHRLNNKTPSLQHQLDAVNKSTSDEYETDDGGAKDEQVGTKTSRHIKGCVQIAFLLIKFCVP